MTMNDHDTIRRIAENVGESRQFRRVCLDLPEEWFEMLALIRRKYAERDGRPVADFDDEMAVGALLNIIENRLHKDLDLLCDGEHPCQKPTPPRDPAEEDIDLVAELPAFFRDDPAP